MSRKILVTTSQFGVVDDGPVSSMRGAGYEVILNPFGRRLTKEEIKELLADPEVVGLLAGLEPLDRDVLSGSHLRCLVRVGSGMANVDTEAASALEIAVDRTAEGPTNAVAELTVGALLAILRDIPTLAGDLSVGTWTKRTGGQIEGRRVMVVGFGLIGRRVAHLLTAFGADIVVADPYVDPASVPYPVVDYGEGLREADVVTFHNSGDRVLFDESSLSVVKRGAVLLNASRGQVVSEEAVIRGLDEGVLSGVWLDVFVDEPYSGRLCGREGVLLTPHVGSYTKEARLRMERDAADKMLALLGSSTDE